MSEIITDIDGYKITSGRKDSLHNLMKRVTDGVSVIPVLINPTEPVKYKVGQECFGFKSG